MKTFVEAKPYSLAAVAPYLDNRYYEVDNQGLARINYVGYYYATAEQCAVIILPKVFINVELETSKAFLFSTSTWLYLAIKQFNARQINNQISETATVQEVIASAPKQQNSELEIVLSLLRFHHENQSLFTFIKKNNQSQKHKIDWIKTVAQQSPTFNEYAQPIYFQPITKERKINVDEELICIFFSILYDLQQRYHFRISLNPSYEIVKGAAFERFKSNAIRRLKAIKNKYFSDQLLRLWHLCYAYFARIEAIRAGRLKPELLLVKDFNIIFEDMIDDLLGERELPKALKEHKDGKRLDHIYRYQSLLFEDAIYYIGDSKYYKEATKLSKNDIYKQFTYSKNVIQYNIDLLNEKELAKNIRYRDELTEGYNITPNFFISAIQVKTLLSSGE